jgi:hypothetical protein
MAPQLRATGKRAVIILATDGEASDGDITAAMKPLEQLPVWVVIRLCTSEKSICDYWNNVDKIIELDMDILEDIKSEARSIYRFNDWLTYGEPLHRMREFGIYLKDFDLIDERTLTSDQMHKLVAGM